MVKDTTYYDILGVEVTATDVELKKAYRKQAIRLHPDKNGNDPKAAEKFQELGEAYGILKNKDSRALYDEMGIDGMKEKTVGEAADIDPAQFFNMIFGGDSFKDWIGELSMLQDVSKTAEVLGEDEEATAEAEKTEDGENKGETAEGDHNLHVGQHLGTSSGLTSEQIEKKKKQKISQHQREEILRLHEESKRTKEERINTLSKNLISRIEMHQAAASNPDALRLYEHKLGVELEDLKIESFGIQLLQLIAKVYVSQANATIASSKTFGVSKIFTSVKTKTNSVKNGFSILKTALDAQASVEEMVREQEAMQQAIDAGEEISDAERYRQAEMERLITGKFLATAWASTKYEVTGVLNKVCDKVLHDKSLSKKARVARAESLLYLGKHLALVKRSPEEDEEARIFEEMMADATAKKSSKKKGKVSDKDVEAFMNHVHEEEERETPTSP